MSTKCGPAAIQFEPFTKGPCTGEDLCIIPPPDTAESAVFCSGDSSQNGARATDRLSLRLASSKPAEHRPPLPSEGVGKGRSMAAACRSSASSSGGILARPGGKQDGIDLVEAVARRLILELQVVELALQARVFARVERGRVGQQGTASDGDSHRRAEQRGHRGRRANPGL